MDSRTLYLVCSITLRLKVRCYRKFERLISRKILEPHLKRMLLSFISTFWIFRSEVSCDFTEVLFENYGRDLLQSDDWVKMRAIIENLEKIVHDECQQIGSLLSMEELASLAKTTEESFREMRRLLALSEKQLQVSEENRDISKEHLSASMQMLQLQEAKARRALSQEEEKCLQLFRVPSNERDDNSYEWYKSRVQDRVVGTCEWFLSHSNYKTRLDQVLGPLFVSADPGCGKSVLAKYLIDHELPHTGTVCYFFFKDQDQNTMRQAVCALLHQLFKNKLFLIRHAMQEYSRNGQSLVNITASLWSILEQAASDAETGPVIFVLDALDECVESDAIDLARKLKDQFYPAHTSQRNRQHDTKIQISAN